MSEPRILNGWIIDKEPTASKSWPQYKYATITATHMLSGATLQWQDEMSGPFCVPPAVDDRVWLTAADKSRPISTAIKKMDEARSFIEKVIVS